MRCSANTRFKVYKLLAFAVCLVMVWAGMASVPFKARAQELSGNLSALPSYGLDTLAAEQIPPDLGQTDIQVFMPETGHTLRGYFLDYWRATGGREMFGLPISEPFASYDGRYSQAFQNGIFQFYPELVWTDEPSVRLMDVGPLLLQERLDDFRNDDRRFGGGGDRRSSAWKAVSPVGQTAQASYQAGGTWFESSGHTLSGGFYNWYQSNEGAFYLGYPISQEVQERGVTAQYFQAGVLLMNEYGIVSMAPIIEEQAAMLGVDTTPVESLGQPVYDELLFWNRDNPNPVGSAYAPGRKWIEVSISQQRLWAYQGDTLISTTLISSGLDPNSTEEGWFHIRYKLEKTDMAGTVNERGEVVTLGEGQEGQPQQPGQSEYQVKDIPDVMYFNYDAEALHGAYWHNNFGNKMSHGCVNLPLDMADFLFGWAPLGTIVWVHQ